MPTQFFRPVKEPGLWGHEWCVEVEMEDEETILCCVVTTEEAAAGSGFETVSRKLKEALRDDMEKRAGAESVEVKVKWLEAPEDWTSMPPAARTRYVLGSIGYVRVPPLDDGHWRRTVPL